VEVRIVKAHFLVREWAFFVAFYPKFDSIFVYMVLIRKVGALTFFGLRRSGRMGLFLAKTLLYALTPPLKFSLILKQIRFIGFQSTLVILLTGAFTGMVLSLQGYYTLTRFGSEALLGPMVALSLIRELGPVLSALMVTGRAGSAMTAEIGIMRNTEQIDALELMGLNPFRYLIVPKLLAGIIALPLLSAIFDVVGIFGGYLVGVRLLGVGEGTYFAEMASYVDMEDILGGVYKSLSFGALITWVCCYKGYSSGFGAEGVSRATTQAVVLSSVLILIWDYFMTSVLF
jgi:phospholipid/cholesterol/gamma-HCH transport system permease protein